MAQNWDYAELSKAAKAAGGPEKYVEMLELASKEAGKWRCCLGLSCGSWCFVIDCGNY